LSLAAGGRQALEMLRGQGKPETGLYLIILTAGDAGLYWWARSGQIKFKGRLKPRPKDLRFRVLSALPKHSPL